jgi:ABC-type transport system substrate-binding protein
MQLLYGPNKPPGINSASFANAKYDELYKQLTVLDDTVPKQAARKETLVAQMHKIIDSETPWITVEFRRIIALQKADLVQPPPDSYSYTAAKFSTVARR